MTASGANVYWWLGAFCGTVINIGWEHGLWGSVVAVLVSTVVMTAADAIIAHRNTAKIVRVT